MKTKAVSGAAKPPAAMMQKEIDWLMRMKGEIRGTVFQGVANLIRSRWGEGGLNAVEEETKKMGHPFYFDKVKSSEWYPAGLSAVFLIASKKVFNLDDAQIMDLGRVKQKMSPITKWMLRYLISKKKVFEKASAYWRKHFTAGSMETVEFNEDKKYAVVCLRDFKPHPIYCVYLKGYIWGVLKLVLKEHENLTITETKCMHRGDEYHEFTFRWG